MRTCNRCDKQRPMAEFIAHQRHRIKYASDGSVDYLIGCLHCRLKRALYDHVNSGLSGPALRKDLAEIGKKIVRDWEEIASGIGENIPIALYAELNLFVEDLAETITEGRGPDIRKAFTKLPITPQATLTPSAASPQSFKKDGGNLTSRKEFHITKHSSKKRKRPAIPTKVRNGDSKQYSSTSKKREIHDEEDESNSSDLDICPRTIVVSHSTSVHRPRGSDDYGLLATPKPAPSLDFARAGATYTPSAMSESSSRNGASSQYRPEARSQSITSMSGLAFQTPERRAGNNVEQRPWPRKQSEHIQIIDLVDKIQEPAYPTVKQENTHQQEPAQHAASTPLPDCPQPLAIGEERKRILKGFRREVESATNRLQLAFHNAAQVLSLAELAEVQKDLDIGRQLDDKTASLDTLARARAGLKKG